METEDNAVADRLASSTEPKMIPRVEVLCKRRLMSESESPAPISKIIGKPPDAARVGVHSLDARGGNDRF